MNANVSKVQKVMLKWKNTQTYTNNENQSTLNNFKIS